MVCAAIADALHGTPWGMDYSEYTEGFRACQQCVNEGRGSQVGGCRAGLVDASLSANLVRLECERISTGVVCRNCLDHRWSCEPSAERSSEVDDESTKKQRRQLNFYKCEQCRKDKKKVSRSL